MVSKPTLSAVLLLFLFFASPAWLVAQNLNVDNILIRKVTRIDPTGNTQDRKVNILISDRKLELISEDKISRDEAQQVLSADGGFILGKLEIGEPPYFMILSEDPRKNFKVLLDTKTHAVFAMHNGQVVRNRLQVVADDTAEDEPARSGWLAYTPPPMAVPIDYHDTSKWNRWDTKPISGLFIAGIGLDRIRWLSQDNDYEDMFGDITEYSGGEIRGLIIKSAAYSAESRFQGRYTRTASVPGRSPPVILISI